MAKTTALFGGALAILLALSGTANAQTSTSWQVSRGKDFVAAGVCVPGSHKCVRLQCLTMDGGGVHWMVDATEPGSSPESTSVSWRIDGSIVSMTMNKAGPSDNGIQGYDAEFSPVAHDQLIEFLKTGNRLTVASDQFVDFSLSLRGSNAALTTFMAECPLTGSMRVASRQAPAEKFSEPHDAVVAMASKQECRANESEIFTAITGAGFGDWDANQYVAIGAENGTLKLIDRTDYTYKISDCQTAKSSSKASAPALSWQPLNAGFGKGTAACNGQADDGSTFCFGLRCEATSNAPEWFTLQIGGGSDRGDVNSTLVIDGSQHFSIPMSEREWKEQWVFSAAYDTEKHRDLVAALKSGSSMYAIVGSGSGSQLSLDGASAEIDRTLAMCSGSEKPTADALAVDPKATKLTVNESDLPPPVTAKIKEIKNFCGPAFVEEGRDEQAVLAEDIDGDGTYDFLVQDYFFCPSAINMICGASHCPIALFVSNKGTWRQFDYILQGYDSFTPEGFLLQCPDPEQKAGVFLENGKLVQINCG
jgi:hypothetical protein